jgi:hypothetical protein
MFPDGLKDSILERIQLINFEALLVSLQVFLVLDNADPNVENSFVSIYDHVAMELLTLFPVCDLSTSVSLPSKENLSGFTDC